MSLDKIEILAHLENINLSLENDIQISKQVRTIIEYIIEITESKEDLTEKELELINKGLENIKKFSFPLINDLYGEYSLKPGSDNDQSK